MPIISDSPKELYVNLYKQLTDKNSPIVVYLKEQDILDAGEKKVGKAIQEFINLFKENEDVMNRKDYDTIEKNGVTYQNVDYDTAKFSMEADEVICAQMEDKVAEIRAALLVSLGNRLGPDFNYDQIKPDTTEIEGLDPQFYDNEAKQIAQFWRMEDQMGQSSNKDLDALIKKEKEKNMEFNHRPVIYEYVEDKETGKKSLKKKERYISHHEKASREYRFFEKKSVKYERKYDLDAYALAPLVLRDVLQNHKEVKGECDRRREYVKFINAQHQAHAVWKEQVKEEMKNYDALVKKLRPNTLKRYEAAMADKNSATSMVAGVRSWLENEHTRYVLHKAIVEEKNQMKAAAAEEYKESEKSYSIYMTDMKKAREEAAAELEKLQQNPILNAETRRQTQEALTGKLSDIETLQDEIKTLDEEIKKDIEQQQKSHEMLMSVQEIVDTYKQNVINLKYNVNTQNLDAVVKYFDLLMKSEVKLEKSIEEKQEQLIAAAKTQQDIQNMVDVALENTGKVFDKLENERKEHLIRDSKINTIKDFVEKGDKKRKEQIKELTAAFKKTRQYCKDKKYVEIEIEQELQKTANSFANRYGWQIGSDAIYLDAEHLTALKKERDEYQKRIDVIGKERDEAEANYKAKMEEITPASIVVTEIADEAEKSIELFSKQLENIKQKHENGTNELYEDLTQASNEGIQKQESAINEQESALLQSYKEMQKTLQDKVKKLNEKKALLDKTVKEQEELAKKEKEAEEAQGVVDEKRGKLEELIITQEAYKKDLEEKKTLALNEFTKKDGEYNKQIEESQKAIEEYEYLEQQFNDDKLSSNRKIEDLATYANEQQKKLTDDAEKQKKYIREKQMESCKELRKMLLDMKALMKDVERPKGLFKFSNSREFTAFRNEIYTYLDDRKLVKDPENPGKMKSVENPDDVLILLECLGEQNLYNVNDPMRKEYLTKVANAVQKISEVAGAYLEAKGSPHRETELGRARHAMATLVGVNTQAILDKVNGMLREEQYCLDSPNLSLVTQKSGVEKADFVKTSGYQYVGDAASRAGDSKTTDQMMKLEDALNHHRVIAENQENREKKNMQKENKELENRQLV